MIPDQLEITVEVKERGPDNKGLIHLVGNNGDSRGVAYAAVASVEDTIGNAMHAAHGVADKMYRHFLQQKHGTQWESYFLQAPMEHVRILGGVKKDVREAINAQA